MSISSAKREFKRGHAWLDIGQPAHDKMTVTVERERSTDKFLGINGWQSEPAALAVSGANGTRLLLGPAFVDHMLEGDLISFTVSPDNLTITDYWPAVEVSGRKSSGAGLISRSGEASRSTSPPPGPSDETGFEGFFKETEERNEPLGIGLPIDPQPRRTKGKMSIGALFGLAAGLAVVLIGIGTLAWLYYSPIRSNHEQIAEIPGPIQDEENNTPVHDRAYWQSLLMNGEMTADELYQAALDTSGDEVLLDIHDDFLRLSANKGKREALRDYAELFDPTKPGGQRTDAVKNAGTALDYYSRLNAAGDRAALQDIRTLCAEIKPKYYENADLRISFDDYCADQ